jgi:uncharacterized protein with von Willebrand factor type A (vWA) domain
MSDLPGLLFDLFIHLHRSGLPLGIEDYLAIIVLLREGIGLWSLEELQFTCRLLWAKSPDEQRRFDEAFTLFVAPALTPRPAATPRAERRSEDAGGEVPATAAQESTKANAALQAPGQVQPGPSTDLGVQELEEGLVPVRRHSGPTPAVGPGAGGVYQLTPRLPITQREMSSIWRHLRLIRRDGPRTELDIEGSIDHIGRKGYLMEPLMRAPRCNQARLLILVDRSEAMRAFALLVEAFLVSVRRGGLLGRVHTFYFDELEDERFFAEMGWRRPRSLERVLAEYAAGGSVTVVSDADAARGLFSDRRARASRAFLDAVRRHTYHYAWLNPLPRARWAETTAERIAQLVPMFPMDRDGMIDAVNILRGYPFPLGVDPDAQWQ